MARPSKKIDADALVGEIALMRSSIWQNGKRKVAAIITEATTDAALLPERAIALVSVTAFAPGAPSRLVRDVPLYEGPQEDDVMPSVWLKR
ncbi:hypothetical protein [Paraburkholderia hospita]|uniref:hypothetical protein n=1 Tax=Paraburkholderia hospita TaxID=169430 RepID=UPI003ECE018F